MNKAIFIDKDGTLLKDVSYNADPSKIELYEGAVDALKQLNKLGFIFIVITNQPGIALGYFTEDKVEGIKNKIADLMKENDLELSGLYYCPHHPDGTVSELKINCSCRKPSPGLLLKAAEELEVDLSHSWMIGDILDDVEAGRAAGCKGILLDNGNETVWDLSGTRKPDAIIRYWDQLVPIIHQSLEEHDKQLETMQEPSMHKS